MEPQVKNRITIRMGASKFEAEVRDRAGKPVHFDLAAMEKAQRRTFTKELVKAFRESSLA